MKDFEIRIQIEILAEQLKLREIDRQFVAIHAQYLVDLTSDLELAPQFAANCSKMLEAVCHRSTQSAALSDQ